MEWRRCGYRSKIRVLKSEFKELTLKFHLDGVGSQCLLDVTVQEWCNSVPFVESPAWQTAGRHPMP